MRARRRQTHLRHVAGAARPAQAACGLARAHNHGAALLLSAQRQRWRALAGRCRSSRLRRRGARSARHEVRRGRWRSVSPSIVSYSRHCVVAALFARFLAAPAQHHTLSFPPDTVLPQALLVSYASCACAPLQRALPVACWRAATLRTAHAAAMSAAAGSGVAQQVFDDADLVLKLATHLAHTATPRQLALAACTTKALRLSLFTGPSAAILRGRCSRFPALLRLVDADSGNVIGLLRGLSFYCGESPPPPQPRWALSDFTWAVDIRLRGEYVLSYTCQHNNGGVGYTEQTYVAPSARLVSSDFPEDDRRTGFRADMYVRRSDGAIARVSDATTYDHPSRYAVPWRESRAPLLQSPGPPVIYSCIVDG